MGRALEFAILGPLEARVGGRPVPLGGLKQRSVLALLLLDANRVVPTERLIDELWGATPPDTAPTALHGYVSHLRKLLEPDRTAGSGWEVLVTQAPGYVLRLPPGALDLERFEDAVRYARELAADGDPAAAAAAFRHALDLWRGPPLADLAGEEFAQQVTPPLEELWIGALEDRFDADLATGDHHRLVPQIEAAIRRHPLRERLRGQLMLALYRSGRQADALAQYAAFRQALAAELGLEPSGALRRLEQSILRQEDSLDPPPPAAPRPAPGHPGRHRRPRRRRLVLVAAGAAAVVGAGVAASILSSGESGRPSEARTLSASETVAIAASAAIAPAPAAATDPVPTPAGLTRVDARTGAIVEAVDVGAHPTSVAVAGRFAWTLDAGDRLITRVERSTGETRRFSPGVVPLDLAADASALWVLGADGETVTRVDAANLAVNEPVMLPGEPQPLEGATTAGAALAVGGGVLWAVTPAGDIVRLDRTGRIDATVRDVRANTISFAEGALWVVTMRGEVLRVDGRTARVTKRAVVPAPSLAAAAAGGGYVWATDPMGGDLWRIDLQAPEPLLHSLRIGIGAAAVAYGEDAVWVANALDGTLRRVDPRTEEVRVVARFKRAPQALTVADGGVWVTLADELERAGAEDVGAAAPTCGPVEAGGAEPDVVVVADLPLHGRSRANAVTIDAAVRLVLARREFRAGRFRVGYQTCDDSTPQAAGFEYEACARNAYAYARSPSVVAEIGPYNSGCAVVQIPIAATAPDGPLPMVSPSNSDSALTHVAASSATGTLERFYPGGVRGYVRVYPPDDAQGAAAAVAAQRLGWRRVLVAERADGGGYVQDLAAGFELAATRAGMRVTRLTYDERTTAVVIRRALRDVDGAFAAGWLDEGGGRLLAALRAAGTATIASDGFLSPDHHPPAGGELLIIVAGLPTSQVDAGHRELLEELAEARPQGLVPSAFWPAFGIAAAEVVLDAVARSDGTRASVRAELLRTELAGPFGLLAFTPHGDPRSPPFTLLRVRAGGQGLSDLGPDLEPTEPAFVVRAP